MPTPARPPPYTVPGALRYAMVVEDGKVRKLHVDEPGPHSFSVSSADTILKDLGVA